MTRSYRIIYKLFDGIVKKLFRINIINKENEPTEGPFIVCANHTSNLDVIVISASLSHQLRYLAKAELFKVPILGSIIRGLGAYPIKRGSGDVGAIKNTISLINNNEVVGFFPQGHRYPKVDPRSTQVQPGIGLVTAKTQCKILPIALQTKSNKVKFFRKTNVIIGKPILYSEYINLDNSKNDYMQIANQSFSKVCDLLESKND